MQGAASRTVVPILVDSSRSMSIADVGGAPRIERARELVTRELMPLLGQSFDREVLAFGESLRGVAPSCVAALDRRSDLSGALAAAAERYRGRAVAGIVLLSDGGDTENGSSSMQVEARRPYLRLA